MKMILSKIMIRRKKKKKWFKIKNDLIIIYYFNFLMHKFAIKIIS